MKSFKFPSEEQRRDLSLEPGTSGTEGSQSTKMAKKKNEEEATVKGLKKLSKRRHSKTNIFKSFDKDLINHFKNAFDFMDDDKDGLISQNDVKILLQNLGMDPEAKEVNDIIKDCTMRKLNFIAFISMFGEKFSELHPPDEVRNAFESLNETKRGFMRIGDFRDVMMTETGEKLNHHEITQLIKDAPKKGNMIDLDKFSKILTFAKDDDHDEEE